MDYYLGLDVGSASVGWAVCDENYNLCRFKNKDMWGIRLFEMAQTAAERRVKRASRRRLERRKQRIDLLQEIFAEEMAKEDSTFFIRLNESRLHLEDKSGDSKYPLFSDEGYTDLEYYMEYPTIFHLRKELLQSSEVHDVRLVYLALHHLIKYRGHFLVQGTLDSVKNFEEAFDRLIEALNNEMDLNISISEDNKNRFQSILKDKKKPRSIKAKELAQLFDFEDNGEDAIPLKSQKGIVEQVCKLVVGNKGDLAKLFMISKDCFDISTCSFADAQYEESIRDGLNDVLMEKALILDLIKTIYDWSILTDILQEEAFISLAKVKQYEEHGKNLGLLRRILLKYTNKSVYNDFFNNEKGKNNYVSYIGQVKKNGKKYSVVRCNEDDFYKELKSILEKIQVEESDLETKNRLLQGCETGDLLPLQRGKENAVIPYQIHELELKQILDNASGYLTFLTLKDADGISNREKIEKLLTFRIPYYVGPLSDRHKEQGANVWIVRRENQYQRIYPWNFEQVVDLEKSNEHFIKRMTNKCTYLIGEDVLPKNSLLYSKYMVLNELNNLRVRGNKISEKQKQDIYHDLFEQCSKVTGKRLLEYLKRDLPELRKEDLSGFDLDFKSNLVY